MTEGKKKASATTKKLNSLPTELLQYIFKQLPGRQIYKCRQVCVRWKQTIDDLADNGEFWKEICKRDHSNTYEQARSKAAPNLSWRDLYKSLSLWPKLKEAKESWTEINDSQGDGGKISSVHAWEGTAAAHKADAIVYYDVETLKQTNRTKLGAYMAFEESNDMIVYLYYPNIRMRWFRTLRIVPKIDKKLHFENTIQHIYVNQFIHFRNKIYYNQVRDDPDKSCKVCTEMFVCDIKNGFKCTLLQTLQDSVWVFGAVGHRLNYINSTGTIYRLIGKKFILSDNLDDGHSFKKLCKHNLMERSNLSNCIVNAYGITHRIPYIPDTMRIYGNIAFIGNSQGIFRIFHQPALYTGQITKPLKEYNLTTLFKLTKSKINGIDVIEKKNGHVIIISTPFKLLSLTLSHNF